MTKYIARYLDKVVGTRKSHRTYTHAIVVQDVEEYHHAQAYERTCSEQDSKNFAYFSEIVREGRNHRYLATQDEAYVTERIAAAQAAVDGGVDAYAALLRDRAIASFEERKAAGGFQPFVATWCGRYDLAQKQIGKFTYPGRKFLAIVVAEVV